MLDYHQLWAVHSLCWSSLYNAILWVGPIVYLNCHFLEVTWKLFVIHLSFWESNLWIISAAGYCFGAFPSFILCFLILWYKLLRIPFCEKNYKSWMKVFKFSVGKFSPKSMSGLSILLLKFCLVYWNYVLEDNTLRLQIVRQEINKKRILFAVDALEFSTSRAKFSLGNWELQGNWAVE